MSGNLDIYSFYGKLKLCKNIYVQTNLKTAFPL